MTSDYDIVTAPLISVIVPCFKMGKYLSCALNSVGKQTYKNWEIFVIDDCCPEKSTFQIVEEFAKLYAKNNVSHILNKHNRGVSYSRNRGIRKSNGSLLAFLDPDDYWDKDYLGSHVQKFVQHPQLDVSYTDLNPTYENGEPTREVWGYSLSQRQNLLFSLYWGNWIIPSAVVAKRDSILACNGFDESPDIQHVEDWDLWYRMIKKNMVFGYTEKPIIFYRRHGNQATNDFSKRIIRINNLRHKHELPSGNTSDWINSLNERIDCLDHNLFNLQNHFIFRCFKKFKNLQFRFKRKFQKKPVSQNTKTLRDFKEWFSDEFSLCNFQAVINASIKFSNQLRQGSDYCYKYANRYNFPILYSSTYAILLDHLNNRLRDNSINEKKDRASYILSFQSNDGLFRDPALQCELAETEDWWGWRHLTAHVLSALTFLDAKSPRTFSCLQPLYGQENARNWIDSLAWQDKPDFVSNTVMNYGVLLQYERDFLNSNDAKEALNQIFDYLNQSVCPKTGLWGMVGEVTNAKALSVGVQTSYHIWNLYFYENREIPHIERAIDNCLKTQNSLGGYGVELNSSACDDIDTIDPLCRFRMMTEYRSKDIVESLKRALPWVLFNQMKDGGFVFKKYSSFAYGHPLMTTEAEESNMFATWFRTLSLAYMSKVIPELKEFENRFQWKHCPGYQFWNF